MTKVSVHFEFDNMQEASRFFGDFGHPKQASPSHPQGLPETPTTGAPPVTNPTIVTSSPPPAAAMTQSTPATALPPAGAPTSTNVDYGLEIRTAMSEMIGRLDKTQLGSGAVKAKEILNKHGFARARDVGADKAAVVLADFKAA